ncbi:MAG: hypothetical protein FP823_15885, partial [Rhodoferax sp.]|nr:hypothetical protein [Rhodoferax sp.]MBU4114825.1 hypothetical protein [Gammaproteobacteria bacterium]
MTTLNEYAALSAYIYNDQRGGGGESSINILGLPADWKKLTELGFTGDTLNTNPFSATAGAYLNQSSGEIVIAYKGTDFLTGREGRSWNTAADLIADVGLGTAVRQLNVPAQLYAASYYAAVKDWAATNGYDDNKISFTGHSLGGGLASNMAVWFNKPATTFAEGPFELSACNRIDMALAIATLTAQAAVSGSAAVLDAINPLRELMLSIPAVFNGDAGNVFNTREAAVTNYYNQGEFLGYLRAVMPTVVGTDIAIDIGNQPLLSLGDSVALHSMNLHAAFLYDDRLRELAKSMPELLPALIDTKLFAADPNSKTRDLITTLVNDQLRQGFAADSALKRFTTDIDKLKGTEGTANTAAWRKALIAVAMDYHYNADAATSKTLFTAESGAIHFNLDDISTTNLKSLPLLRAAASAMGGGDDSNAGTQITNAAAWHVQTGGGAMNWQESTAANDVAVGGAGANVLRAGEGEDFLVGGSDSDTLDGGQGNDVLYGAAGTDTYEFKDSFGKDTVLDSDGQGTLTIDGATLSGGKAAGQRNVWVGKDSAGNFEGYAVYDDRSSATGKKLVITRADGSANSITINNFDLTAATAEGGAGYLGIKLDPTQRIALVQGDGTSVGASTANVWSDRNFNSGNLDSQSTSVQEGNGAGFHIYLAQGAHVGDTITLALTLTGNDLLSGKAGNDTLDGGEGVDILSDDALCGGAGSDRTHSGAGSDLLGKITINSIAACVYSTWAGGIFAYESQGHSSVTLAGGRTHRVSVRSRLRACGRGACGVPAHWHQHRGLHAPAAATENWLRRPGTATRHVCGS